MQKFQALRVVSAERCGSSRPVVIETEAGYFLTKLRGAAQGTSALVAEIIVAALADALGLQVPMRSLIEIDKNLPCQIRDAELWDLLKASHGTNLGFQLLSGARDIRPAEIEKVDENFATQVLWLDALVMNLDRTPRNPNLIKWQGELWLIDHGAALPFQYKWAAVSEASPRSRKYPIQHHLFARYIHQLRIWDELLAAQLSIPVLQSAIAQVPDSFLSPLLAPTASSERLFRRRRAYEAFLWKRLKAPRPFIDEPETLVAGHLDGA